jgi:hypothetical protein
MSSAHTQTFPLPISTATLGTNDFVHQLINLGDARFAPNLIIDVRDVAREHDLQGYRAPEESQA